MKAGHSALLRLACVLIFLSRPAAAIELRAERNSDADLAVTGRLAGVPSGETHYVRRADIRALPTTVLRLQGEFMAGEQQVTVVFLEDLWKALPRLEDGDMVIATCTDGYLSVFAAADFAKLRPMIVLEINGRGPDTWPPPGMTYNPGPYIITVSETIAPAVTHYLDANHKKPWSVAKIEVVNYAARFATIHSGRWAQLSARAIRGREIWLNSCLSCHAGPAGIPGGTKSYRRFEVIEALAAYNKDYFKHYVRAPRELMPDAKMEAHPHYTDDQLAALMAFITAEPPSRPAAP